MKIAVALFALSFLPSAAQADPVPIESDTEISVVGDAPSATPADYVTLTAIFEATGASASESVTQLDGRASRVSEALRALCPALQSRTRGESFPSQSPAGLGLRAGTAVRIQRTVAFDCPAVDKAGKLIDAAIGVSGTELSNVTFSVRDNMKPMLDAVAAATKRAQEKAALVAASLGVKLGPVLSTVVTEEPEGEAIREQLQRGEPALQYGDRVQHIYVTLRYRIGPESR